MRYNPSEVGIKGSLFGLPYTTQEAKIIILPVHLDVTTSYRDGTSKAPDTLLWESTQLDLHLPFVQKPWQLPVAWGKRIVNEKENQKYRHMASMNISHLEKGLPKHEMKHIQEEVNNFCEKIHHQVEEVADFQFTKGKMVGLVGGDHSSALGLLRALSKKYLFDILQIDSHKDLRGNYGGFQYSHASIMRNAIFLSGVTGITQVGIRDYCEEEQIFVKQSKKSIKVFLDEQLHRERMDGKSWKHQVKEIIETLSDHVYISFDVDGLQPDLCPNTGTPVPGGLSFYEAAYLLEEVVKANKKIIGFDLCETGNAIWDANISARILYRMTTLMGLSHGYLHWQ